MKRICMLLLALALSNAIIAKDFVRISYSSRSELESIFSDPNLTVHYYNNTEVFATAERFDANAMVLVDHQAFADNEVYTLVYCPGAEQASYIGEGEALLQTNDYLIVKGAALPYKNDGAVAIFNKEARLPRLTREFPVVTEENPTIREMLDQVNMDSLEATVQHLQDYQSRVWNTDNAYAASDWIASRMEALGLEVEQQPFYASTWLGSGNAAPMSSASSVAQNILTSTWCAAATSIPSHGRLLAAVGRLLVPTTTPLAWPACWRVRES